MEKNPSWFPVKIGALQGSVATFGRGLEGVDHTLQSPWSSPLQGAAGKGLNDWLEEDQCSFNPTFQAVEQLYGIFAQRMCVL